MRTGNEDQQPKAGDDGGFNSKVDPDNFIESIKKVAQQTRPSIL